jgi:hypothetical protein
LTGDDAKYNGSKGMQRGMLRGSQRPSVNPRRLPKAWSPPRASSPLHPHSGSTLRPFRGRTQEYGTLSNDCRQNDKRRSGRG